MSENINARVTITFDFLNVVDDETLQRYYKGDLSECVRELLFEEGIASFIDSYTITSVEKIEKKEDNELIYLL